MTKQTFNYGSPMEEYGKGRGSETKNFKRMVFGSGSARKFVPSDLPNLAAWFAFGRGITSAAGNVSQWDDQSGNARHLIQATGTNQPALQADGSILFDGVDNFLQTGAFTLNQPSTVYFLGRQVTFTNGEVLFDGVSAQMLMRQINPSPTVELLAGGTGAAGNLNFTVGVYAAVASVFNGASSLIQVNNTTVTTGDPGAGNGGGFTVGSTRAASAFANFQIKEAVLYSVAHDATQRQIVINYLTGVGSL